MNPQLFCCSLTVLKLAKAGLGKKKGSVTVSMSEVELKVVVYSNLWILSSYSVIQLYKLKKKFRHPVFPNISGHLNIYFPFEQYSKTQVIKQKCNLKKKNL